MVPYTSNAKRDLLKYPELAYLAAKMRQHRVLCFWLGDGPWVLDGSFELAAHGPLPGIARQVGNLVLAVVVSAKCCQSRAVAWSLCRQPPEEML